MSDTEKREGCQCYECLDDPQAWLINPVVQRMIVCELCGNKRCPHSTHHDNPCTGSNDPGQPGGRYQ